MADADDALNPVPTPQPPTNPQETAVPGPVGVQEEPAPIHLPPPQPAQPPLERDDDMVRLLGRLDFVLVGLVLGLALLLGSFAAHTSEPWMHLATGKALLNGTYHFGADPFAQTTTGTYWVNHSWL